MKTKVRMGTSTAIIAAYAMYIGERERSTTGRCGGLLPVGWTVDLGLAGGGEPTTDEVCGVGVESPAFPCCTSGGDSSQSAGASEMRSLVSSRNLVSGSAIVPPRAKKPR